MQTPSAILVTRPNGGNMRINSRGRSSSQIPLSEWSGTESSPAGTSTRPVDVVHKLYTSRLILQTEAVSLWIFYTYIVDLLLSWVSFIVITFGIKSKITSLQKSSGQWSAMNQTRLYKDWYMPSSFTPPLHHPLPPCYCVHDKNAKTQHFMFNEAQYKVFRLGNGAQYRVFRLGNEPQCNSVRYFSWRMELSIKYLAYRLKPSRL